jgi:hypothetical protein
LRERLANDEAPVAVANHLGPERFDEELRARFAGDKARGVAIWEKAMSEIVEQKPNHRSRK